MYGIDDDMINDQKKSKEIKSGIESLSILFQLRLKGILGCDVLK